VQTFTRWLMLSVTALAAAASWFLPLGKYGSAERDLAVVKRLLEVVETLFSECTICPLISVSWVCPAISIETPSKSWKATEKSFEDDDS
jgi:hypothetical protein